MEGAHGATDLERPHRQRHAGRYRRNGTAAGQRRRRSNAAARVWSTVDGTLVREWKLASPGTTVAISADGKRLWTGHANGKVSLWNVDDGAAIRTLDAHDKRV